MALPLYESLEIDEFEHFFNIFFNISNVFKEIGTLFDENEGCPENSKLSSINNQNYSNLESEENSSKYMSDSNDLTLLNRKRSNPESIVNHDSVREKNQYEENYSEHLYDSNDLTLLNRKRSNPESPVNYDNIRQENLDEFQSNIKENLSITDGHYYNSNDFNIDYKINNINELEFKNIIIKNIIESKCRKNEIDANSLIDNFSIIFKRISSQIIDFYTQRFSFYSEKGITVPMQQRKDYNDKKINTIMKDIIQIILNLLFNYDTLEQAIIDNNKKLLKKISIKKISKGKVDVFYLKELHNKSIMDVCLNYSSITKKSDGKENDLNNILPAELSRKRSFEFLFKINFESLINLTFYEFYKNDFKEIIAYLNEYQITNQEEFQKKQNYLNKLIYSFDKRLTYLSSPDVIANKRKSK